MSTEASFAPATGGLGRPQLVPLFLVALASVGYEIALTRWFAIVSWSEYGYWVISITMVGIAASGVVLNLAKDWLLADVQRVRRAFAWLPAAMIVSLAGGTIALTAIDFNPLALQNHATMDAQLWRIGAYYAALFPFFFLSGAFIGLYFVAFGSDISRIYAADLVGAGASGIVVVALMFVLHPFALPLVLLPVLALAGWLLVRAPAGRGALLALTIGAVAAVLLFARADYNEYKAIAAPLRVEGNERLQVIKSPRGVYEVLGNFTERLDVDLSNNEAMLGGAEPIATYGLYADGNRLTSLPRERPGALPYLNASLDALPYRLVPKAPAVLLVGSRGGYRLDEAAQLGAGRIVALEPEPTIHSLIGQYRPDLQGDARRLATAPSAYLRSVAGQPEASFDLVDIALDFQGSSDISKYSFTVEGLAAYHRALSPTGMISVPVSIREFTVYAVKLVLTARQALRAAGVADPSRHIVVYRSAWNARILLSKQPFDAAAIAAIQRFCDERSFDTPYLPGVDPAGAKIWNDLPAVSFEQVQLGRPGERQDALAAEIRAYVLPGGQRWPATVDLSPATTDRPHFFSVLRLAALPAIFERIDLVPREEIGALVSVAVLAQSVVIALLVLSLPLFRRKTMGMHARLVSRSIAYFAGLGLGFLFIEIYLIEKATYFLNDRTLGFSLALGSMLLYSGIGSWWSGRFTEHAHNDARLLRRGLRRACLVILGFCAFAFAFADTLLPLGIAWPLPVRIAVLLLAIAPVGIALGFPFACGMAALQPYPHFVPWAWSLNGAFSVVASPLAHLLAMGHGNRVLVASGIGLYLLVWLWPPLARRSAAQPALAGA
ncbi:MAG: hypothetical protein IPM15_12935 [Betaproteobacteria bacterium]|nr:hypothetical protein [Betaproteobacteria bacterium]